MKTNSDVYSKTVFVTLGEVFIARNLFYTDFWPTFLTHFRGARVVLIVHEHKAKVYEERLGREGVEVVGVRFQDRGLRHKILSALAISANATATNTWEKMRAYARGQHSLLVTYGKRLYTNIFGNSTTYKKWLRRQLLSISPDPNLKEVFDRYTPDAVFVTSLSNFDFDIPVAREAKRRGIRLIGMPRSWDNFTSHGLIRVMPDELIVQNEYLKEAALSYQAPEPDMPMHVVGLPHYDVYTRAKSVVVPRDVFMERLGLDVSKKLVVYGAMGDFLFPHEGKVAPLLEKVVAERFGSQMQILFRAHPTFQSPLEQMETFVHVRPDRIALHVDKARPEHELDEEETKHFISSIYWSDFVITSASTFAVDAAALGKPTICIAYDPGGKVPYWYSNERFYDTYTHFEALVATGGLTIVRSDQELVSAIASLLVDPNQGKKGRTKLLERFVEPFDGKSGERLGNLAAQLLLKPRESSI